MRHPLRLSIAVWCSLSILPLRAQTITATIVGVITDSTGSRVAGATVTAVNTLTGETHVTTANDIGDYRLTALPLGQYRIEAQAPGFKRYVRSGLTLEVNQNA